MKINFLHQNASEKLLLFFGGWASEPTFFQHLHTEDYNVVLVYEYSEIVLNQELEKLLNQYKEINVLAWSFGVFVSNLLLASYKNKIVHSVAINGTLQAINEHFGISKAIFEATLKNLSETSCVKFFRRMCGDSITFARFSAIARQRTIDNLHQELANLGTKILNAENSTCIFKTALIANNDLIIPTEHQVRFWKSQNVDIQVINGAHFIFYSYQQWNQLLTNSL